MNCMKYPNPPIADCNSCDPWKALGPTGPTGDKGSDGEFVGLPGLIGTMNNVDVITLVCDTATGFLITETLPPLVPWVSVAWTLYSPGMYKIMSILPFIPMISLLGEGGIDVILTKSAVTEMQVFKNAPEAPSTNIMEMVNTSPTTLTQIPAGGGRNIALLYQSLWYTPSAPSGGGILTLHLRPIIY